MTVIGYPTPGKTKSRIILDAFCKGAAGCVADEHCRELLPGATAFYGVTAATKHLFDQARAEGRDWYYIDNAYFDPWRQVYFRVTKNSLQHSGRGKSDGARFARLGVAVKPWQPGGEHVLVCPQSEEFMRVCAGYPGWLEETLAELKRITAREVRVRPWSRDKQDWYRTLPDDLRNCHALVTYSSASAITALLAGIPAICTASDCIAAPIAHWPLDSVKWPPRIVGREEWAKVVADHQWTLGEMESGLCWRMLNPQTVAA
jgi:hypothetical protein